ncbi:lysozyme inhibitor LprI family protein [Bordetella bronchialis]|nr:lysozyme inhibitor LprI family protein [Bordetella bronchialis]
MNRTTPRNRMACMSIMAVAMWALAGGTALAAEPAPPRPSISTPGAQAVSPGATVSAPRTAAAILDLCQSAIGDKPRTAMQACLKAELKKAKDVMRGAYAQVEAGLKQIDSAATPEALHALKHSQDSFNSFLHKECKRQGAAMLGGSGAGDMDLACQVALTQWRTAQLRQN